MTNRRGFVHLPLPSEGRGIKAMHPRHVHVQKHRGEIVVQEMPERFFARSGADNVLIQLRQHYFVSQQLVGAIVDYENANFAVRHGCSLAFLNHRTSQFLSSDSNSSVSTGLAMYSLAPASIHFSRSPFIAFAVRATIGSSLKLCFCRMDLIVS